MPHHVAAVLYVHWLKGFFSITPIFPVIRYYAHVIWLGGADKEGHIEYILIECILNYLKLLIRIVPNSVKIVDFNL